MHRETLWTWVVALGLLLSGAWYATSQTTTHKESVIWDFENGVFSRGVEILPGVGSGGHVIQDEGVDLPTRAKLNLEGGSISCTDDLVNNAVKCVVSGGVGGSAMILDLGNNGSDESSDLGKIVTAGDTNNIFNEVLPNVLMINLGLDWPKADLADALVTNPGNCALGAKAGGVSATGLAEDCEDVATQSELNTHAGTTSAVHGSTAANTPNTLMQRDGAGQVAATTMTATTFVGALTGNAATAAQAAANGNNCGEGLAARGVNTAWAGEDCFDVLTQAEGDLKQDVVTAGAGLANTGAIFRTASTEVDFLTDGGASNLTCGASQQGKMQVMDSGEFQYCGGETTPALHAGLPTQTGLTWNVTPSGCTGDGAGGALTVNGSNQIICSADDGGAGGSGDVTAVGNCTTGACLDGNSGGGSTLALYDGDSHKGTFQTANLTADRVYTFPNEAGTVPVVSGTPSSGQVAEWTSPTAVRGVSALTMTQMPPAVRAAVAVSMARMGGF